MRAIPLIAVTSLLVVGCSTTLHTEHVPVGSPPKAGALYSLPAAIVDVEVTFEVDSCSLDGDFSRLGYRIEDAKISHSLGPDSRETYRLDYALLNSSTKTTNASLLWHPNGMIKSINADIEDRSAQVASSIAGTALNVLKASLLPAAPTSAARGCHKALVDKIVTLKRLREVDMPAARNADSVLAEGRKRVNEANAKVETLRVKIADAIAAKDAAAQAAAKGQLPAAQGELNAALKDVEGKTLQAPAIQSKITVLAKLLSATAKLPNWIPVATSATQSDESCERIKTSQAIFNKQLTDDAGNEILPRPDSASNFEADVCVKLFPSARRAPTAELSSGSNGEPASYDGVVYRLPALGIVVVRRASEKEARITASTPISFPQFGAKGLVWLRNEAFDKNNVKASFNEDGSLSELSFGASARAERMAAAMLGASESIKEMMKLRADAAKAKAKAESDEEKAAQQKQLDALDAEITLLQKQRTLESARAPARDAMDKESEQLQKEINVERLRQELAALKKKSE